jgi:hypothetical protein
MGKEEESRTGDRKAYQHQCHVAVAAKSEYIFKMDFGARKLSGTKMADGSGAH